LSKFTPNLADLTKPLCDLLSKQNQWTWGEPQRKAYAAVKKAVTENPVLASKSPDHSVSRRILVRTGSSPDSGAGERREASCCVHLQGMSPTEQRYAQIEKESLALTWACERFQDFLLGLHFQVETDHKPLVPLFNSKLLDELPLRIQRFRRRMMQFSFTVRHVPGKQLSTADTLSRAPVYMTSSTDDDFAGEVDAYVQTMVSSLPATEKRLEEVTVHQQQDSVCRQIATYCLQGWPNKSELPKGVWPFHSIAGELSVPVDERQSSYYSS